MNEGVRVEAAAARIVPALRDMVRDLDLTTDELMAFVAWLGDVAASGELVLLSDVLGISRMVDDQTHAGAGGTASNVLGPFYVAGAPWIGNPGSIVRTEDDGDAITVRGCVTDAATGAPLDGAIVDVWHANSAGAYSNEDSTVGRWHLRGRQIAAADGSYSIDTVRPLHYTVKHDGPVGRLLETLGRHPWRPAHVHLMVTAAGYAPLVTQVYVANTPYLDDDTIGGVKPELVASVADGSLRFDIALAPEKAALAAAAG